MGTIYQNKAELIAAAIVTIFRIILIAAATVNTLGKNSSFYGPQPWELCQELCSHGQRSGLVVDDKNIHSLHN